MSYNSISSVEATSDNTIEGISDVYGLGKIAFVILLVEPNMSLEEAKKIYERMPELGEKAKCQSPNGSYGYWGIAETVKEAINVATGSTQIPASWAKNYL